VTGRVNHSHIAHEMSRAGIEAKHRSRFRFRCQRSLSAFSLSQGVGRSRQLFVFFECFVVKTGSEKAQKAQEGMSDYLSRFCAFLRRYSILFNAKAAKIAKRGRG
jgi:hypothetical protein